VTTSIHGISTSEFLLINSLNEVICLLENGFIDFFFGLGCFGVDL
jgi:hypothetical protein